MRIIDNRIDVEMPVIRLESMSNGSIVVMPFDELFGITDLELLFESAERVGCPSFEVFYMEVLVCLINKARTKMCSEVVGFERLREYIVAIAKCER